MPRKPNTNNPICSKDDDHGHMRKNGKRNNKQRYRCSKCGARATEGGIKKGGQPQGVKPLSNAERQKRWREKQKESKKDT